MSKNGTPKRGPPFQDSRKTFRRIWGLEKFFEKFPKNLAIKKESPKKAEAATENEKNVTEDVKEVDTESEVKIEKSDIDAEEVETESVDA